MYQPSMTKKVVIGAFIALDIVMIAGAFYVVFL